MRRVAIVAALALLVFAVAAGAQEKWVRGEVTAITGNSITVKTADGVMTFVVDKTTDVVVRGGSTATREAHKAGQEGATLEKLFKVGDKVEVHYSEAGGKMIAAEIRGGASGAPTSPAAVTAATKGSSASGIVTAVSDSSITIKAKSGEMTFAIDPKTQVVGRGVGTAAKAAKEAGKPTTVTTFIKMNDEVRISFTEKHADEVYLLRSAAK